jgi:hypothetical protein
MTDVVHSQFSFARVTSAINAAIAAATPADGSISLAKLAVQATATILGNNSGSNASPSALSASAARTVLGLATTDSPTFASLVVGDGAAANPSIRGTTSSNSGIYFTAPNNIRFAINGFNVYGFDGGGNTNLRSTAAVRWANSGDPLGTPDLVLNRDAANTLAQRNGTNGQKFRVAKTWTSSTNFEQFEIDAAGDASNFDIAACVGSAGGTARGIRIGGKDAAGTFTSWLSFATDGLATLVKDIDFSPSASRTLATNGQFTFERVSDTSLNLVYRGEDGTTRRTGVPIGTTLGSSTSGFSFAMALLFG